MVTWGGLDTWPGLLEVECVAAWCGEPKVVTWPKDLGRGADP